MAEIFSLKYPQSLGVYDDYADAQRQCHPDELSTDLSVRLIDKVSGADAYTMRRDPP